MRQHQVPLDAAEVEVAEEVIEAGRCAVQVGVVADLLERWEMHSRLIRVEFPGVDVKHDELM